MRYSSLNMFCLGFCSIIWNIMIKFFLTPHNYTKVILCIFCNFFFLYYTLFTAFFIVTYSIYFSLTTKCFLIMTLSYMTSILSFNVFIVRCFHSPMSGLFFPLGEELTYSEYEWHMYINTYLMHIQHDCTLSNVIPCSVNSNVKPINMHLFSYSISFFLTLNNIKY